MTEAEKESKRLRARPAQPPPPRFGTGWKRDVNPEAHKTTQALFGAAARLPPEALELLRWTGQPKDQKRTSSCVGQAIAKATAIRLRKTMGEQAPLEPSAQAIYAFAVRRGMEDPTAKMRDEGCVPADAMAAVSEMGVPSEEAWPFDPEAIEKDPPWDVFSNAAKFSHFDWFRINVDGAYRSTAIAQALAKGYPVIFGLDLWQAYMDHREGTIQKADDDRVGGHMQVIVGYRTAPNGREFLVMNSWGEEWGERGFAWIHEGVLASERASDFYVITVAA